MPALHFLSVISPLSLILEIGPWVLKEPGWCIWLVACGATAVLSAFDIFYYYGYSFPPISNLFIAILLYFVLILITHPRLPELHELMGRALVLSIITLFAAIAFTLIVGLFGRGKRLPSPIYYWRH